MQVSELMTRKVRVVSPNVTIQHAAKIMADIDVGVVPVGEEDHLIGISRTAISPSAELRKARGQIQRSERS
jgi:predicted transcriptional regulator